MSDETEDQIRKGLKLLAEDVQAPEGEAGGSRADVAPAENLAAARRCARGCGFCATVGALAATGTFSGGHEAAAKVAYRGDQRLRARASEAD